MHRHACVRVRRCGQRRFTAHVLLAGPVWMLLPTVHAVQDSLSRAPFWALNFTVALHTALDGHLHAHDLPHTTLAAVFICRAILDVVQRRRLLPFFDSAYQVRPYACSLPPLAPP